MMIPELHRANAAVDPVEVETGVLGEDHLPLRLFLFRQANPQLQERILRLPPHGNLPAVQLGNGVGQILGDLDGRPVRAESEIFLPTFPFTPDALDLAVVVNGQHAVGAHVGNGRMEKILDQRFGLRLKNANLRRADVRLHRAGRQPGLDALRLFRPSHRDFQRRQA